MTPPTDDWSDLSRAWTEPDPTAPDRVAEARALLKRVRRRDRIARVNFYAEALSAVLGGAFIVGFAVVRGGGWPLMAVGVVFGGFALIAALASRRAAPPVTDAGPDQALKLALDQARSGLVWAGWGMAVTVAAVATLTAIFVLEPPPEGVRPFVAAIVGGAFAVFAAGYGLHIRHCLRRLRTYRHTLTEMAAEDAVDMNTRQM